MTFFFQEKHFILHNQRVYKIFYVYIFILDNVLTIIQQYFYFNTFFINYISLFYFRNFNFKFNIIAHVL